MILKDYIQERYRERNKLYLFLDILFSLLTFYFAIRLLFIVISALLVSNQSDDSATALLARMILFLWIALFNLGCLKVSWRKEKIFCIDIRCSNYCYE